MKYILTSNDDAVRYIPESAVLYIKHYKDDGSWGIVLSNGLELSISGSPRLFDIWEDTDDVFQKIKGMS